MKKQLLATLALTAFATPSIQAEGQWLLGGSALWVENQYDETFGGAFRAGYNWQNDNDLGITTDWELEIGYYELVNEFTSNSVNLRGSQQMLPILSNIRINIPIIGAFGVYGGGGAGVTVVTTNIDQAGIGEIEDQNAEFTWTAFLGVSYDISNQARIFGGYRYQKTAGDDVDKGSDPVRTAESDFNLFEVGLNLYF